MQIYVNRQVRTIDGQDFEPAITLRAALYGACVALVDTDRAASLEEKLKLHRLAKKIMDPGDGSGFVDLSAEEISLLQRRLAAAFPSVQFVGQLYDMLEDKYDPRASLTEAQRMAEYHDRVQPLAPNGGILP